MSIERKIVGSPVTAADLNALNYLASKYVQLNEDITLSKNTIVGKYASYYLDSTVNEDYSGDCILHYSTSLSDVTFILSLEWSNSQGETLTTTTIGENGVITVYAPSGYTRFNNIGTITIRNGKYREESSLPASILSFSASATTITVGDTVTFTGTLLNEDSEPLANETIAIYRDATQVTTVTTDSNGAFTYTTVRLTISNTYNFKAVFAGNESYEGSQSIITITVNKITTNLVIDVPLSLVYSDEFNITGTLTDASSNNLSGKTVDLYVGSTKVDSGTTNSSGVVQFTQTPVHMGNHSFQLKFDGDSTYANVDSETVTRSIGKETSVLSLSSPVNNSSVYTGESVSVAGTLTDNDGTAMTGKTIVVSESGSQITTFTTGNGGAFSGSISGLSTASHSLKFEFVADDYYTGSSVTRTVTVGDHTYSLTAVASSTSISVGSSVTISGNLKKDNSNWASQTITIYDGSTSLGTATTDGSGNYSKTISGLAEGQHTIKAVHTNVESSSVSVTVSQVAPASLVVTGTKNILSYADSESSVLTATVKDSSNNPISGQSVVFKKGSTTLDTKTTDSNGQCTYTYASAGSGDVTLTVECSLLQETYVVEDCKFYDSCTSNAKASAWTIPSGVTSTYSSDGWRATATAYKQIKLTEKLTAPCTVEITVVDYSTPSFSNPPVIIYQYTNGETTPNQSILLSDSSSNMTVLGNTITHLPIKGGVYKIEYDSTMKVYENNTLLASASNGVGLPTRFEFHIGSGSGRYVVYKDVKIKPL